MIPDKPATGGPSSYIRQKRFIELSIMLGAFVVVPKFMLLLAPSLWDGNQASPAVLLQAIWDLFFVFAFLFISDPRLLRKREYWRFDFRITGTALALAASLFIIAIILGLVMSGAGVKPSPDSFPFSKETLLPLILGAIARLAIGALFEELFFRIYLLERLRGLGVPLPVGFGISLVLFAWGHSYEGLAGIVGSAVLGAVFGYAWLRWRSVWANSLAHFLYNLSVYLIAVFSTRAVSI